MPSLDHAQNNERIRLGYNYLNGVEAVKAALFSELTTPGSSEFVNTQALEGGKVVSIAPKLKHYKIEAIKEDGKGLELIESNVEKDDKVYILIQEKIQDDKRGFNIALSRNTNWDEEDDKENPIY